MRGSGTEPDKIDDLEDAEGVDNEKRDEPVALTITCRVPERIAFDNDRPERNDDDKWNKRRE